MKKLGERKAVELVTSLLTPSDDKIAVGPGDDCAAIEFGDFYLVITTDMTSVTTHFPPGITPYQMGWHIVAINLSDLAAKGALPLGVVVATGMPGKYKLDFLTELIKGMDRCAVRYGTRIIGGDLKSHEHLTLTGTAIGIVHQKEFMPRIGAKPGDIVCVTGELGRAGVGYYSLKHKKSGKNQELLRGLFEPEPRLAEGHALAKSESVSSCMDISDGLADSLHQMAKLNDVGYEINFEDVPMDQNAVELANKLSVPIGDLTIYFGGDYELLATVKKDMWEFAKHAVTIVGGKLTEIGKVTKNKKLVLVKDGKTRVLENRGYEHFKWEM